MKTEPNLRTTLIVLSLLATGCVAETSGGGTDSSSHWLDACEQDSDCGGALSCHCNVCTVTCDDASECSNLGATAVCASDWGSCGVNATLRICAPEGQDAGDTPTDEPSASESDPAASSPVNPTDVESDPSESTLDESDAGETTQDESEPSETTPPAQDASTAPNETTSDASTNQTDEGPTLTETLDAGPIPDDAITEDDLSACSNDDECIVVDYAHCCGSTKRAINAAFEDEYAAHPEWQSFFEEELCATIGICRDDSAVTTAQCARNGDEAQGFCSLVFPEPSTALSGEACQANAECASNVCVRTAAASGAFGDFECSQCMDEATRDFACDEDADCCEGTCCLGCGEREGLCTLQ